MNAELLRLGAEQASRCRVLRGGCYGLCAMAPNLVIRRYALASQRPDPEIDRLSLTRQPGETVYSQLQWAQDQAASDDDVTRILKAHLESDHVAQELTLEAKEGELHDDNSVESRIRQLRK